MAHGGDIFVSLDGINWTEPGGTRSELYRVAAGDNGVITVGQAGTILKSNDGRLWTQEASGTTNRLRGAVFADGVWVVVGNNSTILTSPDGRQWTSRIPNDASVGFAAVAHGPGVFVAVGGSEVNSKATVWTSPDGVTWAPQYILPIGGFFLPDPLNDVIYVPEKQGFIAVGPGSLLTSSVGSAWVPLQSTNGVPFLSGSGIAYGNGLLVVADINGIYTSTNVLNWVNVPTPSQVFGLTSVSYFDGAFWAAGFDPRAPAPGAVILRSPDARVWSVSARPSVQIFNISPGGPGLLAVGSVGTVLQLSSSTMPPEFRPWESRFLSDGSFAFTLDGSPDASLSVDVSQDLKVWSPFRTVSNAVGRIELIDAAPKTSSARFYRARQE
jgi:hypothetical protein